MKSPEVKTFAQEFEEMIETFALACGTSFDQAAEDMVFSIRRIRENRHKAEEVEQHILTREGENEDE